MAQTAALIYGAVLPAMPVLEPGTYFASDSFVKLNLSITKLLTKSVTVRVVSPSSGKFPDFFPIFPETSGKLPEQFYMEPFTTTNLPNKCAFAYNDAFERILQHLWTSLM